LAQLFEGPVCRGIENIGRGKKHKLKRIVEDFQANRTEEPLKPFGDRGGKVRSKTTKKHNKWKSLPLEKHLAKLARLKVSPAAASYFSNHCSAKKDSADESSKSNSGSMSSHGKDLEDISAKKKPAAQKKTRRVPTIITTVSPESEKDTAPRAQPNLTTSGPENLIEAAETLAASLGACLFLSCQTFLFHLMHGVFLLCAA